MHLDDIFHPSSSGDQGPVSHHTFLCERREGNFLKRRKWFQGCDLQTVFEICACEVYRVPHCLKVPVKSS